MSLINFFIAKKNHTAEVAKTRLKNILMQQGKINNKPKLKEDILEIICKYINIDPKMVIINLDEQDSKKTSVLKLKIIISKDMKYK
ncbi:cell division topological specificity factor MinE [Pantoea sp. SoEX]|uniref:cell division topological specificity factor MinE n=1 Tax=Pantoea sp. SoEX TaxID=2576763 RepID=UPI001359C083|nr:cell division topological specificity factor MinE [Pantoea sp. SoEX]MXP50925.1 cell division topological specificity factor MinE [Pantoea sp. SoEX]